MKKPGLERKLLIGNVVFAVLVALEIAEYLVGVGLTSGALPWLALLAVMASWPIFYFFMHISHLWRSKE